MHCPDLFWNQSNALDGYDGLCGKTKIHLNWVFVVDITNNIWRRYPNFPIDGFKDQSHHENVSNGFEAGLSFDKSGNRYLLNLKDLLQKKK